MPTANEWPSGVGSRNLLAESSAIGVTNRQFAYDDENELTSVYLTNVWRTDFVV